MVHVLRSSARVYMREKERQSEQDGKEEEKKITRKQIFILCPSTFVMLYHGVSSANSRGSMTKREREKEITIHLLLNLNVSRLHETERLQSKY
jgi:hypothetical protein